MVEVDHVLLPPKGDFFVSEAHKCRFPTGIVDLRDWDDRDFDTAVPVMSSGQRAWLADALVR